MIASSYRLFLLCAVALAVTLGLPAQQVSATLAAGSLPYAVAVDSANGLLHVLNSGSNSVSSFSLTTHALIHTTNVGSSPEGIAVSSSGIVYVASTFSNAVNVISPANNYSVATVSVGYHPQAIIVNPVNGKVYTACYGAYPQNQIYIIDPANNNSTTYVYSSSNYPWRLTVDTTTGTVFSVASNGSSSAATNLTIINPTTNATTSVPVGSTVQAVAVNSTSHVVYVVNEGNNNVSVLTPQGAGYSSLTVQVGSYPVDVALDSKGKVYVANLGASTLSVLDPSNGYAQSTITVANGPSNIAYDAGKNKIISISQNANKASVVNLANLSVTNLTVGTFPYAIVTSASRGESYTANQNSNNATVITN